MSLLKPFVSGGGGTEVVRPDRILVDGQPEWEVSHIVRARGSSRKR